MRHAAATILVFLFAATISGQTPTPSPSPEPIREEVVVVADRSESSVTDTPASVDVISQQTVRSTAAVMPDDVVRQSVGFSTFRRTSGRSSNPTTQGVSFRGIGSSGASRAAVLLDGVPLNDPFGGWVQWERVPLIGIEQVEVLRGGASSLYGNYALSGAINIIPRKPAREHAFSADAFLGSQDTFGASAFGGRSFRNFGADLSATIFQTRGYRPVDIAIRGPVDGFAGVRFSSVSGRFSQVIEKNNSLFVRPSYFGEVRTNGTGLQTNRSHIRSIVIGGDHRFSSDIRLEWRAFGGSQIYDQTFSTINGPRTAESLNRIQRVPSQNIGASAIVSFSIGDHSVVSGADARQVRGASDEIGFAGGLVTTKIGSGGRDSGIGVFVRDAFRLNDRVSLIGGVRFDHWRSARGISSSLTVSTGQTSVIEFQDRAEMSVNPQLALIASINDSVSVYASGSSSYRSPTLNELYRSFRVGNVNTLANAELRAESSRNLESGVTLRRRVFGLRVAAFWASVDRPIANVTLSVTPTLITRQRRNMGRTRSAGFEFEFDANYKRFKLSAGYQFVDPKIVEFIADPTLVGLRVPQVARHQATFQLRHELPKWTFAVQGRASGEQFDDDQNQFRLEPYIQIDLFASRRFGSTSIYAAIENVTNSKYSIGRTPIRSLSSGATIRVGVRWN
ncbi:MAG: TonB-dependent receptor [Blastocatellia bacterium]|nr:TonB-dependent receptor [Blastocatellia bacterium]